MKKILLFGLCLIFAVSCKKTEFSPEGPTDVRLRNVSDRNFIEVTVKSSENEEDTHNIGTINSGTVSEYSRFKKAYPNLEITAWINIGGSLVSFSTGTVDFTYLQYMGQDRITYEVYIQDLNARKLAISNRIIEEPLVLK
jgi:hypothetical protein